MKNMQWLHGGNGRGCRFSFFFFWGGGGEVFNPTNLHPSGFCCNTSAASAAANATASFCHPYWTHLQINMAQLISSFLLFYHFYHAFSLGIKCYLNRAVLEYGKGMQYLTFIPWNIVTKRELKTFIQLGSINQWVSFVCKRMMISRY